MKDIVVMNLGNEGVVDAITTVLALRTQENIDVKYVVAHIPEDDIIILSTEHIRLTGDDDIHTIVSAMPTGTIVTLNNWEQVVVHQIG